MPQQMALTHLSHNEHALQAAWGTRGSTEAMYHLRPKHMLSVCPVIREGRAPNTWDNLACSKESKWSQDTGERCIFQFESFDLSSTSLMDPCLVRSRTASCADVCDSAAGLQVANHPQTFTTSHTPVQLAVLDLSKPGAISGGSHDPAQQ